MEFSKQITYVSAIVMTITCLNFVKGKNQTSAFITQVQTVSNRQSSATIECAFKLMKDASNAHVTRIAEGTDYCERQTKAWPSPAFEQGFEYHKLTTLLHNYKPLLGDFYNEVDSHYLDSEIKVGDRFIFIIQRTGIGRMLIDFKNEQEATTILEFSVRPDTFRIYNRINGTGGKREKGPHPFPDFKTYKLEFEVQELRWMIYVDDTYFTKFVHRHPVTLIREIQVSVSPVFKYLSKAFDPRM
ncbi:uncharacterized protein LOC132749663 [Ruditapes philippinarum]|uniref:uncharacterized protein LOC132749663 n=1 Tax=Ruditapes philippinarum TaxID=129788 RepID=UPI00295AEEE4|nr:uncharacterized protein LOC132749663 [Ruditapes philippinarum]